MALGMLWILLAAALLLLCAVGIGILLGRRRREHSTTDASAPIARAERVRELGSFRQAITRRQTALTGIIALGAVVLLVAGVIAARPLSAQTIQPVSSSRDVMLCLDVSGSMSDVDVEVLSVFEELLEGFEGERIGLTIFNSSPVQIFPLTDDYDFVASHLADIRESFDYLEEIPEHWVGTLNGAGASLIGDGLAACALGFDHPNDDRARSIILATDNEIYGASIVTVQQAAEFAKAQGVRVFTINPVEGKDEAVSAELAEAAEITGGLAFGLRDTTTVDDIVSEVKKQDSAELRGQAQVVWTDTPDLWIAFLLIGLLGFLVLLWRVRL